MSNLNHKGPENLGPRTGKQSGNCKKKKHQIRFCMKAISIVEKEDEEN